MNELIVNEVLKILHGTGNFVLNQAPDIIQQYINNTAIESVGWIIGMGILGLVIIGLGIWWLCKPCDCGDRMGGSFFVIAGTIILMLGILINSITYYKITHNPKGYLLEQVIILYKK